MALPNNLSVRRSLNGWLRFFVVISLALQGVIAAAPLHAHDAHAASAQSVPCPHGNDCGGDSGKPAQAQHCDTSHGHTPAGLTGPCWTGAVASPSTPLPGSPALFSVHIPELPFRPPLALRG